MRVLFYIQLLIVLLAGFYLFTREDELLILIFLSILVQAITLYDKLKTGVIFFLLFHLIFLGLMNLPIIWFIFAAIYLLISLLLAVLLNNTTILFSNSFQFKKSSKNYKDPHSLFVNLMRTKQENKKNSSNPHRVKTKNSEQTFSSKDKTPTVQDAEFKEK